MKLLLFPYADGWGDATSFQSHSVHGMSQQTDPSLHSCGYGVWPYLRHGLETLWCFSLMEPADWTTESWTD